MNDSTYEEKLTSKITTALFIALMLLFLALAIWRWVAGGWDFLSILFLCLFALFLFYVVNYRVLLIRMTETDLVLKFGIISWKLPMVDLGACRLDDSPFYIRYGGAGIHFASVQGQYRAFFNFLEYPRLLIEFKKKRGMVEALVLSTKQPDSIMDLLGSARS
ncbi:MAG: hypothetical protein PVI78_11135 [Anaerolineales bacterium]|jgi:Ca2+/Na+ antiporter